MSVAVFLGVHNADPMCSSSAVAMGIVKAVFQIAFAREPDKTFNQSVQFWGL